MDSKKYLTVSQYAEIKCISKQAVYKQLNNKLKDFVVMVENKKYINIAALDSTEQQKVEQLLNNFKSTVEQPTDNQIQPFLEKQIEEKDNTIKSLLKQIEDLQNQNSRLTDIIHNSQLLMAADKKVFLEQENQKQKRKFLNIFKKKE